jgi:hypothetical protein
MFPPVPDEERRDSRRVLQPGLYRSGTSGRLDLEHHVIGQHLGGSLFHEKLSREVRA